MEHLNNYLNQSPNAKLLVGKRRYGGKIAGFVAVGINNPEEMLSLIDNGYGYEKHLTDIEWYPYAEGENITEVLIELDCRMGKALEGNVGNKLFDAYEMSVNAIEKVLIEADSTEISHHLANFRVEELPYVELAKQYRTAKVVGIDWSLIQYAALKYVNAEGGFPHMEQRVKEEVSLLSNADDVYVMVPDNKLSFDEVPRNTKYIILLFNGPFWDSCTEIPLRGYYRNTEWDLGGETVTMKDMEHVYKHPISLRAWLCEVVKQPTYVKSELGW